MYISESFIPILKNNPSEAKIKSHQLMGKLGGATGTWSAHFISYPKINWLRFSEKFKEQFFEKCCKNIRGTNI